MRQKERKIEDVNSMPQSAGHFVVVPSVQYLLTQLKFSFLRSTTLQCSQISSFLPLYANLLFTYTRDRKRTGKETERQQAAESREGRRKRARERQRQRESKRERERRVTESFPTPIPHSKQPLCFSPTFLSSFWALLSKFTTRPARMPVEHCHPLRDSV